MHVGKGVFIQNLGTGVRTDFETMQLEMELGVEAEAQGFGSIWTSEHHFSGYHMVPGVTQLLTYFAARTRTVKLGSMVVVLPWQEPTRIAEELSVLDHLSDRRLLLGLGRGLGKIEFDGLRLDMSESRQRFVEYAEALIESFETGHVEYDGELYKQPKIPVRPAPIASLRGRTYASAVSPASMDIMIKLGVGLLVNAQKPWPATVAEVQDYHDRFVAANGYEPPKPILVCYAAVHESEAAAREMFEHYVVDNALSTVNHYEFDNINLADIPGYEYYGKLAANIAKHGKEKFVRFLADLQPSGTPEQITEQLTDRVRSLDAAGVVVNLSFADMPDDVARGHQELFASQVLPKLRGIDAHRELPGTPQLTTFH